MKCALWELRSSANNETADACTTGIARARGPMTLCLAHGRVLPWLAPSPRVLRRTAWRADDVLAAIGDVVSTAAGRLDSSVLQRPTDPLLDLFATNLVDISERLLELTWRLGALALQMAKE